MAPEMWYAINMMARNVIDLEIAWVAQQLLPMSARNRRIHYLAAISVSLISELTGLHTVTVAAPLCFVLFYMGLPVLLWRPPVGERLICGVLVLLIVLSCELVGAAALLVADVSIYRIDVTAPALMFAVRMAYMGLMAVLARAVGAFVRHVRGRRGTAGSEGAGPWGWYGAFFGAQALAATAMWYGAFSSQTLEFEAYTGYALVLLLCFAADALAIVSLERSGAALRERQRAELLEARLEEYLEQGRSALLAAEDVARFRHDQRNHLQVVRRLMERGELEHARAYVTELRVGLRGGGPVAKTDR